MIATRQINANDNFRSLSYDTPNAIPLVRQPLGNENNASTNQLATAKSIIHIK